ncbi:MAG: hypothetical protein GDA67_00025 [Nitrospira sp. CR1.3]|nr:hypothetical protein [Nitrospira sp. CR1.3]
MMRGIGYLTILFWVLSALLFQPIDGHGEERFTGHIWKQIVTEAEKLGLPVKFLKAVPSDFVTFEFDDLQAFAAEYHLGEHRMVLNRALSFNVAGGTLRPLNRLTNGEMETLYHELFHAYMDYVMTTRAGDQGDPILAFARSQQRCRYSTVLITPVVQRRAETEERFLSERESWEALNEAWAVFIGWAVWNQLESGRQSAGSIQKPGKNRDAWIRRLREADREGKIRGYYEPENPDERAIARKRFLAPASRVSPEEVRHLMSEALGFSDGLIQQATQVLAPAQILPQDRPCK